MTNVFIYSHGRREREREKNVEICFSSSSSSFVVFSTIIEIHFSDFCYYSHQFVNNDEYVSVIHCSHLLCEDRSYLFLVHSMSMINVINNCERERIQKSRQFFVLFSSELNSNDPIQCTHLISYPEVETQLTHRTTIVTETTPINDANQVQHENEENFFRDLETIFSSLLSLSIRKGFLAANY